MPVKCEMAAKKYIKIAVLLLVMAGTALQAVDVEFPLIQSMSYFPYADNHTLSKNQWRLSLNMYYSNVTGNVNNFHDPASSSIFADNRGDFIAGSDPFANTGAIADLAGLLDGTTTRFTPHATNTPTDGGKEGGRDVRFTMRFWEDYVDSTNPPANAEAPQTELDIGAQQLAETGSTGGGQHIIGGGVVR